MVATPSGCVTLALTLFPILMTICSTSLFAETAIPALHHLIQRIQTEIQTLTSELFGLLTRNNHGFLPANEPGNCARCHKGGTVPFLDDPDQVLENAYTNYKLIINDRSNGVHNPGYVKKLLQDSINSVKQMAK